MSRHAKNNTASAVFTYYERSRLKYGTQKQRLNKDSLKHFDACSLCLQPVIDPMCCLQGHLYCKECIYANILAQKKEIKRSKKHFEEQQQDLQAKEEEKKQQRKEEEIAAFGRTELGILPETHQVFRARPEEGDTTKKSDPGPKSSSTDVVLFSGSKDTIVSNPADPEKEKLTLNSYWVPSLTPSAAPQLIKKPKTEVMCAEGNHPIRLKKLIKVKFSPVTAQIEKSDPKHVHNHRYCCPICRRTLTDAPKAIVLKSCGHVICLGCSEKFKNEKICTVCDTPFKSDHLILLQSGGTGFAGHDEKIMAKKEAVGAWV
eukprot:Phypoly_transcript_11399.p1 GENE.Phypoly_transcript_11399~~Phypoly_transcript_11399.p1  ORF type:complete len:316 (+),score=61.30 Phypoly_transcript_11399:96-1043(+)